MRRKATRIESENTLVTDARLEGLCGYGRRKIACAQGEVGALLNLAGSHLHIVHVEPKIFGGIHEVVGFKTKLDPDHLTHGRCRQGMPGILPFDRKTIDTRLDICNERVVDCI